jgi:hypothetical protein
MCLLPRPTLRRDREQELNEFVHSSPPQLNTASHYSMYNTEVYVYMYCIYTIYLPLVKYI